jgi:tRNA nucleotidyltransferase (CCA-adding enzyme)
VLEEVETTISLDREDLKKLLKQTKELIEKIGKKVGNGRRIILGGSLAKKTIIKKSEQDIDIFVVFEKEGETKELPKILKRAGLKFEIIHGSRDYFQIKQNGLKFEIIPILRLKKTELVKNISDFSPLHVEYIKNKILKNRKLEKEIKFAKAFCFANGVYGAESYIQGFSGYALEVLVCHYGSFQSFLKGIQTDTFVDPEKLFKNKSEAFREINQSKLLSPIVLVDPTFRYRNVCAGLNRESLERLKLVSKNFIKNPSVDYFRRKTFDENRFIERAKKENLTVIELHLSTNKPEGDVAGTKMKKFFNFVLQELIRKGQVVKDAEFVYENGQNAMGYLSVRELSELKIRGPEKKMTLALEEFKRIRGKVYFENGRAFSMERVSLQEILNRQAIPSKDMEVNFSFKLINDEKPRPFSK